MMLQHSKAHALCASRSSLGFHTRLHSIATVRPRFACGAAGKRSDGGGGSPSSGQPYSRQRSQKPKRSYDSRYNDAPQYQGSELALMIASKIKVSSSLQDLEDVVNEWGGSFFFINTSAAFTRAGKLAERNPAAAKPLLDRLAAIWDTMIHVSDAQGLANVLWACGKLGYTSSQLWSSTVEAFLPRLENGEANSQDISNVVYGMALAAAANGGSVPGLSRAEVVEALVQLTGHMQVFVTHPYMPGVQAQHIFNVMWSCAKLRINPGDEQLCSLLQAMARPAMQEDAAPQGLANTLYAVHELQQSNVWQPAVREQVWQQLLGEGQLRKIAHGNGQDIANTCLDLAHLSSAGVVPTSFARERVLQLLQGSAAEQVTKWNAQQVANSMWACAKLGLHEQDFVQRAAAAAPGWLPHAAAPALNQVAWACGTLQFNPQQLLVGVVQRSQQLLQHCCSENSRGRSKVLPARECISLPAMVGWAAAVLNMQQLAGDVKALIASSGAYLLHRGTALHRGDADRLRVIHTWLVQHQLLDGQGLAGLLTAEQLAVCEAAALTGPKAS